MIFENLRVVLLKIQGLLDVMLCHLAGYLLQCFEGSNTTFFGVKQLQKNSHAGKGACYVCMVIVCSGWPERVVRQGGSSGWACTGWEVGRKSKR